MVKQGSGYVEGQMWGVHDAVRQNMANSYTMPVRPPNVKASEYLRSISKGSVDVGDRDVIADVVRVYNQTSPIVAAHGNIQVRETGVPFSVPVITKASDGAEKDEGTNGGTDTDSAITILPVGFKAYTGREVLITQELMEDAGFDLSNEILTLGLGRTLPVFAADCVTAIESAFLVSTTFTPTLTAGTAWAFQDVLDAYHEIPARNRVGGVQFACNEDTAKALIETLDADAAPKAAAIGFTKENIVEDDAIPAGVLFVGRILNYLAIGMRKPILVSAREVSEGRIYEVKPRLAVALRDATAVSCRKLKP